MKLAKFWQLWRQRHYLPDSVVLEEISSIKLALITILAVFVIFIVLIVWANFATIQETRMVFGVVEPKHKIPVVQNLAKSRIARILVTNGDIVKQGQPLIELSKQDVAKQLQQLKVREINLHLDAIRWQAFIDQGKTDFKKTASDLVKKSYTKFKDQKLLNSMITNQVQRLTLQNQSYQDQLTINQAQVTRYQNHQNQLTTQHKLLENNLDLLNKQLEMYQKLIKSNAISRHDLIKMQQSVNSAQSDLAVLATSQAEVTQNLAQAKAQLNAVEAKLKQAALKSLNDVNNQLATLRQSITQSTNLTNALNITAPVSGIVKNLSVTNGSKITNGQLLMNIIPLKRQLIVNAKIPAYEIYRISVGDNVRIKPLNNSAKFMTMPGEIQAISNNSYTDSTGQSYYRAVINVDQSKITDLDNKQPLLPGMNVQSYIATGEQTVLAYLLNPR